MTKRHSALSHISDDDLLFKYDRLLLDLGWVQDRLQETKGDPKFRAAHQHYITQERLISEDTDRVLTELDERGLRN